MAANRIPARKTTKSASTEECFTAAEIRAHAMAQCLSPDEVTSIAFDAIEWLRIHLHMFRIPQPFEHELDDDAATLELVMAIERYVERMVDERQPYKD